MAEKLDGEVAAKRGDHRENTPKQQREGMSRRIDADRLERTAQGLRALADLHEAGELSMALRSFSSKKAIFEALGTRTNSNGYYHVGDTGEHSDESPEAAELWALLEGKDPETARAEELHNMQKAVQGSKIPGYFATPADLAADMVDRLDIRRASGEPWLMLEPSAGSGAILDEVAQLAHEPEAVTVYEVNPTLCEILQAKGYDARPRDFLEQEPGAVRYDAVLMNPPFEKLQDVDHVRHAFEFLKPGGRLVAIMSPGPFFRDTAKAREFREWFENLGGEVEDIEAGRFKESGTGVASKLVTIDKPEELEEPEAVEIYPREAPSFEISEQPSLF
jgi:SAM-dependent methyltransferase